jgi:hypothetical protein
MVPWPWQRDKMECYHLIKYNGTNLEISGLSFQGVQLGKLAIEQKLLQAVSHALMLIDASQYLFCQAVKNAPDDESKKKYYDLMMQDKVRAQDIWMGLAVLASSPESKQVEEALIKMILQNHSRALQVEQEEKIKPPIEAVEADSPNTIKIGKSSLKDKISELGDTYIDSPTANKFQKTNTRINSEIDNSGLLRLITEKFSKEELRTLCFEYGMDFDDLSGEGKQAKARELILYLKRRDRLADFYDFLMNYLSKRD